MNYQMGDKVTVLSKSVGETIHESNMIKMAKNTNQPFLYYVYQNRKGYHVLNASKPREKVDGGDYFLDKDFIPFTQSEEELFMELVKEKITPEQYESYRKRG